MYPAFRCNCSNFGTVVGFDLTALMFFTGVGSLTAGTGVMSFLNASANGIYDGGQVFMASISICFGVFLLTYMNIMTQRLARKKVLESNL